MESTTTATATTISDREPAARPLPLRRNLQFQTLWIGTTASTLGVSVADIAFPLAILAMTRSPALAGLFAAMQALAALREAAVTGGVPYLGASAGSNLACPTIRTTNDMPIVEVPSLAALGLIPFQLNPHYLDADPGSTHQGETRQQRLAEFLEENDVPVLGLREGSWLAVSGRHAVLSGASTGRLFRRDAPAAEVPTGTDLSFLLQVTPHFDAGT